MARQLLIDADFSLFRACAAVEREVVFTNEAGAAVHVLNSSFDEALETFLRDIRKLQHDLMSTDAILVFSGPNNFRKTVWDGYKMNRAATRKPLCYWALIDYLREDDEFKVVSEDCLEGDDYIGILATRPSSVERIVVSDDKDMQTLPGTKLYRMGKLDEITHDFAENFWLYQTLMGDSTDGYKGCPGCGPVAAKRVLERPGDPWANVLDAYREAYRKDKDPNKAKWLGLEPDALALLNARLARILRHTDWDGKARQPILWTPET